jgi:hypothetical protein
MLFKKGSQIAQARYFDGIKFSFWDESLAVTATAEELKLNGWVKVEPIIPSLKPPKPKKIKVPKQKAPKLPPKGWVNASDRQNRRKWKPKDPNINVYIEQATTISWEWMIFGGGDYITQRRWDKLADAKKHVEEQYQKHVRGEFIDPNLLDRVLGTISK